LLAWDEPPAGGIHPSLQPVETVSLPPVARRLRHPTDNGPTGRHSAGGRHGMKLWDM
jgi:hypothetical protein